jgi:hypothetical protein
VTEPVDTFAEQFEAQFGVVGVSTLTERILLALGPALRAQAGGLLPTLLEGLVGPALDVDVIVTDPSGRPGWSPLFDLDSSPHPAWLGQLLGVPVDLAVNSDQARERILDRPAQRRGTPAALTTAVQAVLTGSRRVELVERDGDAYQLRVRVYEAEVPDVTAVERAVASQKPVGVVATVQVLTGATYQHMTDVHGPAYADFTADFTSYDAARDHLPEAP